MRSNVAAEDRHAEERPLFRSVPAYREIYSEPLFRTRCLEEWRRAERTGRPELLALLHGLEPGCDSRWLVERLCSTFRETDVIGWYSEGTCLGVLLVEIGKGDLIHAKHAVLEKIQAQVLHGPDSMSHGIEVTLEVLPPFTGRDDGDGNTGVMESLREELYPESGTVRALKRAFDVLGAAFLLIVLAPLLLAAGIAIRMTSPGPALFRQMRVGFRGKLFQMYKFRTMAMGSDDRPHREYVVRFIAGEVEKRPDERGQGVYKLTHDQRVTRVGRLLRRTSLDELPQLWNILRGDMSLVGPRPALPYEVAEYELWHLRRVHELKPGATGIWQVHGRSRCTFDEMTRMDLQHASYNALSVYLRVLLETPLAVIRGHGAH